MRKMLFYQFATVLIISCLMFSCEQQSFNDLQNENIEFSFNLNSMHLKSSPDSCESLSYATKIVLTIETVSGGATEYIDTELELYTLNESFFSPKIALLVGQYKLTKLLLIDDNNNVLFVAPLEGSLLAQNIENPLPVEFTVIKDQAISVNVEVVCAINNAPEDFGLVSFWLNKVETFSFLIAIAELGKDLILDADLTVTSGDYSYNKHLEAIANNLVTIKDRYENYTLLIEKEGYQSYEQIFTNAELDEFYDKPLVVELVKDESTDLVDIDGNVYQTIQIGEQIWMAENLKVTHYSNGDSIPYVTDYVEWGTLGDNNIDKACCFYNNNANGEKDIYGALYTWTAAMNDHSSSDANPSGIQGVCPAGWHLPSDAEWKELEMYLGMSKSEVDHFDQRGTNEGSKLAGRANFWENGALESNAEFGTSGFSALPGGIRSGYNSTFINIHRNSCWWSSTESYTYYAYGRTLNYNNSAVYRLNNLKWHGFSVRCLMD